MSAAAAEKLVACKPVEGRKASVEFTKDAHGLDVAILKDPRGFVAQVHLYGGQVTAWKNERGEDLLFVSSKANFKPPKAIRGGIPISFPQFSNLGLTEQHGFARNKLWAIDPDPAPLPPSGDNKATIDLILKQSSIEDQKIWNHSFEFRLRVMLGPEGELGLTARVRNVDSKPFSFTVAFQTYFAVTDISEVRIEGLETLDYLDNLQNRDRFTEQGDALTFEGEVDRVYLNTPTKIAIIDHEKKTTFVVKKDGLPDAGLCTHLQTFKGAGRGTHILIYTKTGLVISFKWFGTHGKGRRRPWPTSGTTSTNIQYACSQQPLRSPSH